MSPQNRLLSVVVAGTALIAGPALSQQPSGNADHASHRAGPAGSSAPGPASASEMATGEVRRIDKAAGKLTLRHGEIRSLDMPPMTMVFQVIDAALLDLVKVGDKVRFRADQHGGAYRVIELQPAN